MKIYVLAPYTNEVIEALETFITVQDGSVELIGDNEKIQTIFIENNERFKVVDLKTEEDIISYTKERIDKDSFIITCDISDFSKKKIFNLSSDSEFGNINILSLPGYDCYYYISTFSKKRRYYYEDKKTSIINSYKFMKSLGIKRINVGLVKSQVSKSDELETNIIKMLEGDRKYNYLNILNPISVKDIFNRNLNINLLIFDNYDITKVFIDAIKTVTYTKVACVSYFNDNKKGYNNYFISCNEVKNKQEILFSILMLFNIWKYSNSKKKNSA